MGNESTTKFHQQVNLGDVYGDGNPPINVGVIVATDGSDDGVIITTPKGGQLVVIENCGGKLVCHIWASGLDDDPTVSMTIAVEDYEEA